MEKLDKILVCLKDRHQAPWLLSYAGLISRVCGSRQVHLLHVTDIAEPSKQVGLSQAKEPDAAELSALADAHFRGHGGEEIACRSIVESPMVAILNYALDQSADLVVMGRRGPERDEATLARRVTMKSTCSVLVVPRSTEARIDEILVPVRNSECSARAVEAACRIATVTRAKVRCLHVFPVSAICAESEPAFAEHLALMLKATERENEILLSSVDTGGVAVDCRCAPDSAGRPAEIILETVYREGASLVVIGARGRSGAAGVLLGAVTEHLICESPVPVLAVKNRSACGCSTGIVRRKGSASRMALAV